MCPRARRNAPGSIVVGGPARNRTGIAGLGNLCFIHLSNGAPNFDYKIWSPFRRLSAPLFYLDDRGATPNRMKTRILCLCEPLVLLPCLQCDCLCDGSMVAPEIGWLESSTVTEMNCLQVRRAHKRGSLHLSGNAARCFTRNPVLHVRAPDLELSALPRKWVFRSASGKLRGGIPKGFRV
jgi:hypothetical protein